MTSTSTDSFLPAGRQAISDSIGTDLGLMRDAAEISMQIMRQLYDAVEEGVYPSEIDRLMGELCIEYQVQSAFKGQPGSKLPFPANLCIGVNEEILHGIPSNTRKFTKGDLVKIDMGIIYKGHYTDHCVTVGIGEISAEDERLLKTGKFAVESAVSKVKAGIHTGDLGNIMNSIVTVAGFEVLMDFVGHGIGTSLHEMPEIPAYGIPGRGAKLVKGQVVCIEAQVVAGSNDVHIDRDGWTVKTNDYSKGVMFEYMVEAETEGGKLLTDTREWSILKV